MGASISKIYFLHLHICLDQADKTVVMGSIVNEKGVVL
jgi:hypothetical protein